MYVYEQDIKATQRNHTTMQSKDS